MEALPTHRPSPQMEVPIQIRSLPGSAWANHLPEEPYDNVRCYASSATGELKNPVPDFHFLRKARHITARVGPVPYARQHRRNLKRQHLIHLPVSPEWTPIIAGEFRPAETRRSVRTSLLETTLEQVLKVMAWIVAWISA